MTRFYLFLCLFTLGTPQLQGQELSIGQIPFRLGMTMTEAVAMVHDPIYLDDLGNTNTSAMWTVREKHGENNFVLIGSIIFRNGRAETLERDLKTFSTEDAFDLANVLFQAVEGLKRSNPSTDINTSKRFISSETGEVKQIIIGTGLRHIRMLIPEKGGKAELTVAEVLSLAKPKPLRDSIQ